MSTPHELAAELFAGPYAWPGGYPRYAITDDGGALCSCCCGKEKKRIGRSDPRDGFYIVDLEINWEDADLKCDHCYEPIPSAYGGDE